MTIFSGPPFKVIGERTGNIAASFHTLSEAQAYADSAHDLAEDGGHFQVVEIVWRGGSKRLPDLERNRT